MDLSGRIKEELLICQICYGKFTQADKLPKLLACSHTFCADCILQYLCKRKKSKHRFPCPLCRKETNLGKEGVHGLGNNLTVMGLLDILERSPQKEAGDNRGKYDRDRGGSLRPSSKSPKRRPTLRNVGWSSPDMSKQYPGSIRAQAAPTLQCDNCQAVATDSLMCGHVFCDHCVRKCHGGDCIQCSMVESRARRKSVERPPPSNPAYDSTPEVSPTAPYKPPVPARTSAVKPIGSLSRTFASAPALNQERYGTLTRHQARADSTLPRVDEHGLGGAGGFRSHEPTATSTSPRPHTVHLSSTLPSKNKAFGMSLRSHMVLLPRSTQSTQSLPAAAGSQHPSPPGRLFSPPQPPPRRISNEGTALASPLRCLTKFGHFSTVRLQTNAFQQPTNIAASEFTNDWAVVDSLNMTLQIFDRDGGYISMFKVLGIKSACFLSPDRLAVCSHRGVEIYSPDGTKLRDLLIGRTDDVVAYKHSGFIAVQPRSLHFYSPTYSEYRVLSRRSQGKLKRSTSFQQITSVAVTNNADIVVLDSKLGDVAVMDLSGKVKLLIDPSREACGKLLTPEALAVDRTGNILISDSGNRRLLRFSANGMFSRCLLNFSLGAVPGNQGDTTVHGVAVGGGGAMGVVLAGTNIAEVRVYQLV